MYQHYGIPCKSAAFPDVKVNDDFAYFLNFTLYPAHNREGREPNVKTFVPHFPLNSSGIACCIAKLNKRHERVKIKFLYISILRADSHTLLPLRHT